MAGTENEAQPIETGGSKRTAPEHEAQPIETGRLKRTAPVAGLAARTTGEAVIRALRRRVGSEPADGAAFHARTAERYAELLGHSKGVLMKVGQMLSFVSLGSTIPEEYQALYRSALGRLQADAPPMAADLARATLEGELGRPIDTVFATFDPYPLAAASIGQVHVARLLDGRRVAVKIQYPGVDRAIRADLANDQLLATFFSLFQSMLPSLSRLDMRVVAEEVAARITEELDYVSEAANQAEFAAAYRGHPFIHVPEVVAELCTPRVLVQDLVEGLRWTEAVEADRDLRDQWGEVVWRFAIGSLRRLGLFNADPHPGNYLFHPDGTVSFLDFGCVERFRPEQVKAMREIVTAMVHQDGDGMRRALIAVGAIDVATGPSGQALLEWWSGSFEFVLGPQPFTVTPDVVAAGLKGEFSPAGPNGKVLRSFSAPPGWVFLTRIDSGMLSVLGQLRATGYWRAIQAELDEGAEPVTDLGRAEQGFWAERAASGG
jgi:predicted unusual protein kinase regulating ubiquinone biosynthesis (AarF/ABC1/UbiB family)